MKTLCVLLASALLLVGCSTQHTVGAGNPSLGVVSITGPSDTVVPTSGRLSVSDAATLMGAPFVGPTSPVLVMPSNANGVVTVNFTSNSSTGVAAQLGLTVGAYSFNFTTSNISGALGAGNTVTIIYDGLHFGENGSCTTWVASNVVFTQGAVGGYDTLAGSYEATCHNSQNAKDGDRGTFLLKRPGTLAPPPPPPPPPPPVCSGVVLGGLEVRDGNNWNPAPQPLDHNDEKLRIHVTVTPPGCAVPTVTIVAVSDPDHPWITHVEYDSVSGYVTFDVVGNSSKTDTRAGTLNINGLVVAVLQDHK
jgi:hypothetical protein